MKKLLLGLGTVAAVAAPIACTVSCIEPDAVISIKSNLPNNLNWKTRGDTSAAIIDKINHILLIKTTWEKDVYKGAAGGAGLTTVKGTPEIYAIFGLTPYA